MVTRPGCGAAPHHTARRNAAPLRRCMSPLSFTLRNGLTLLPAAALAFALPEALVGTASIGQIDVVKVARTGVHMKRRAEIDLRPDRNRRVNVQLVRRTNRRRQHDGQCAKNTEPDKTFLGHHDFPANSYRQCPLVARAAHRVHAIAGNLHEKVFFSAHFIPDSASR